MGGVSVRTAGGLVLRDKWTIHTEEYPLGREDGLGGIGIAVRVEGEPPPEHFHAWCTRDEDSFGVDMEIELDDDERPVVQKYTVTPPDGVQSSDDTRQPVLELAKQAAKGHGFFVQETHLRDAGLKNERYKVVVEAGDKAKAEGITPMWRYVNAQLRKAGLTDSEGLSKGRIEHLRSEANQLPEYKDRKESK